ncbi:DNA-3-methyladenine glycosylase [Nocardia puris]|uniref:Putative 3-methyladenine DNA glycosylase n=1 Tax=Nocardia puris TaxID=208602 RepID=A0A366DHS3_9NOCA|nr:DNA-3-methyladenine glycosylase [Nocardia puris]MBF6213443.1 DNA-3-methyladenine glycosylase [Nocardia puris]MBF6369388.1 DNA-3-methyladenine glycosylase [Nocardia puris]MBF6462323.1 DNA-3-methyladenine glycosylase [Nocardia puris]RBO89632.1 DNA-3-methyladenine glycosylase [Nocardia puris]
MSTVSVEELVVEPPAAARRLLGSVLRAGPVALRIVEVEAYGGDPAGPWPDPASHSGRGRTKRNAVMFGPAGFLYVYLSYGMHTCLNVTSGPDGTASAVLLRAGEVVEGLDVVRARRPAARSDADLARGPGNLGTAMGITLDDYGTPLFDPHAPIRLELNGALDPALVASGPRVGVSTAADRPWRFWLPASPAVSAYRRSPRAPSAAAS